MRRVPAVLLLAIFSFSLIGPALFAGAGADLPACCRRGGTHHCAMMDMAQDADAPPSGLSLNTLLSKCPFFPKGGAVLSGSGAALLAAAQPESRTVQHHRATPLRPVSRYYLAVDRSHQKRGPPVLPL